MLSEGTVDEHSLGSKDSNKEIKANGWNPWASVMGTSIIPTKVTLKLQMDINPLEYTHKNYMNKNCPYNIRTDENFSMWFTNTALKV